MGSSEITFTEGDPDNTLARLLEADLGKLRRKTSWGVEAHRVYALPNMADRCMELAERCSPDVVLIWTSGNVFAEETVVSGVYQRLRPFYPLAERIANGLRDVAGGGVEGAGSLRGALFRVPRELAGRFLGRAPLVYPEEAEAATIEALRRLAAHWPVVCRLAYANYRQPEQAQEVQRRVQRYNAVVAAECASLSVPYFDPETAVSQAGGSYRMAADHLHADMNTRSLSAEIAARYIVQALDACKPERAVDDAGT